VNRLQGRARSTLRILEVTESFATGTMEVVRLIAEGAGRAGHRVAIAYGERPETPAHLRDRVAAEVELIPLRWTSRTLGTQVRSARQLRRLARGWKPDVIHLHSSFAGAVGAVTVSTLAPTIYTPHAYSFLADVSPPRRAAYRWIERYVAHRVALVGAVSESEARLARELGARAVEVVPNGIPELDDRRPAPRAPRVGPPTVVTMGRIVPQRRPLRTAQILRAVSDLADVCWIGGPGPDERLSQAVRDLEIPVTGWLDRDEAVRRLSEATVLLNWSAWDSHPLSVLEAMALDVLVIGSDIEANRTLVGADQVRGGDDDAVELLRDVLTDEDRRDAMLERQRERGGSFASARMVSDWLAIYDSLACR
jgi:glycosyltransferase involved in cell wall biosynthesis